MDTILLTGRVFLGLVFAVAALAKLIERDGFRAALSSLGIRPSIARPLSIAVPLAELAVGCAVLIPSLARWGALAAFALLTAFSSALVVAWARGHEPECDCFGRLDLLSTGRRPLARNGALALVAVLIAWRGGTYAGPFAGSAAILVAVTVLLAAALIRLGPGSSRRSLRRPSIGDRAQIPVLTDLSGQVIDLRRPDGRATLLLFWNPGCAPCQYMVPHLQAWELGVPTGAPRLVIASSGTAGANRAVGLVSAIALGGSEETAELFAVPGRPAAVLLDPTGRVASELILGAPAILAALAAPE